MKFFKKEKKEPENLKELLESFRELKKSFEEVSRELKKQKKENKINFQKIGFVRYNPFSEVGGDQSFSLALLDGNNDGFVITSLYAREANRVYGKPIKNGQSEYSLSEEEKKALKEALNKENETREKNNKPDGSSANSGSSGSY